jgi:hypothetical protein
LRQREAFGVRQLAGAFVKHGRAESGSKLHALQDASRPFSERPVTRAFAEVPSAQMSQHLAEDLQRKLAVLLPERPNEPAGRGVPQGKPWFGWLTL